MSRRIACGLEPGGAVVRLADDREAGLLQHPAREAAERRVVVHDQHAHTHNPTIVALRTSNSYPGKP
jgi:hypothetical protein